MGQQALATTVANPKHDATNNNGWKPAIYARLSKEDTEAKKKDVSLSIEHQIEILTSYVKDKGWQPPKVFQDDNKTGTNFARKDFQAMYDAAKRGEINVIIIKDLSRFGRNVSKSLQYFDEIGEMGVRFISIQEGVDTDDPKCPALTVLPMFFMFAEWHSSTTSEKIKAVLANNAKQGKYRASYAPYGYQKDPADKHKLVIDPYSASIIKRIYEMRLQKYSYGAITNILNNEGVLSPSAYCKSIHGKSTNTTSKQNKWTKDSLNVLFKNPAYKGDTANGRKAVISYKNSKQVRQPMENWIVVENTHDPIVSRDDWQKCFDMIKTIGRVRRTKESEIMPFTGILVCPDCDYKMRHNHSYYTLKSGERKRHNNYNCRSYMTQGKTACSSHYISLKDLTNIVIADIRLQAGQVLENEDAMRERFYNLKASKHKTQTDTEKLALKAAQTRLAQLDKLLQATFEKSVLGDLSNEMLEEFARKYKTEKVELQEKVAQLTASIEQQNQATHDVETYITLMKKYADIQELDRATVALLIDHITVSANDITPREIVIHYNFVGNV